MYARRSIDPPGRLYWEVMMKLLSIQVGRPRKVKWRRRTVTTGIYKAPVEGRIMLRPYATAYCSVTSRPAGRAIILNSSKRII